MRLLRENDGQRGPPDRYESVHDSAGLALGCLGRAVEHWRWNGRDENHRANQCRADVVPVPPRRGKDQLSGRGKGGDREESTVAEAAEDDVVAEGIDNSTAAEALATLTH